MFRLRIILGAKNPLPLPYGEWMTRDILVYLYINPRGQEVGLYTFWLVGILELQLAVDPLGGS